MSISGTLLVAITASFLKPLLSANQSVQLPVVNFYGHYNGVLPSEENGIDLPDEDNLFLTLRLPRLLASPESSDFEMKRQFDPWGGKRHRIDKGDDYGRKRQFSPWGGKRSYSGSWSVFEDSTDVEAPSAGSISLLKKRDLNSWNAKRGLNSWSEKRNMDAKGLNKVFKSWEGKGNFKLWGEKRNFNAWGGKRFVKKIKGSKSDQKKINKSGKRQTFNSWGGKRATHIEPKIKEIESSKDDSIPSTYSVVIEGLKR